MTHEMTSRTRLRKAAMTHVNKPKIKYPQQRKAQVSQIKENMSR